MRRLKIWFRIIYQFVTSLNCVKKARLLSAEQTKDIVVGQNQSLIRLGDGELNILEGKGIHYQDADKMLQVEMGDLIDYYIKQNGKCEYLLSMPNEFLKCRGSKLVKKRVWVASWARFRYVFKKIYDRSIDYGEAFLFAKKYEIVYREIWKEKELVIFVHNDEEYAKSFAEKYEKSVIFVKVPPHNSYEQIDSIVEEIQKAVDENLKEKEKGIVLLSAGPCAKVVIYRLKNLGVQMIDTGHCWDEPLALIDVEEKR